MSRLLWPFIYAASIVAAPPLIAAEIPFPAAAPAAVPIAGARIFPYRMRLRALNANP